MIKCNTDVIIAKLHRMSKYRFRIVGCILEIDSNYNTIQEAERFCNNYGFTYQHMPMTEARRYSFA